MANLDTTSSGHLFFDTDSKTVIKAQTESDALLASFMVERKGPNRKGHIFVIDALLNVVRGPGFRMEYIVLRNGKIFSQMRRNSSILDVGTCFSPFTAFYLTKLLQNPAFKPEQVTFPSGVDILLQVAAYRRIVAKKRSLTYNPSMSAVPQIILEQVAGLFADMDRDTLSSREFWPDPDQDLSSHVFFLARKELGVMSLVHRSWTESAQRAMRSIARVVDLDGLYSFLQSPLSGRWTRSLLIGPRSKNGPFVEPTLQRFEAMHLLKTILCIAPKMKLLSIQMQFLPLEPFSLRKEAPAFVRELGRLRSLKTLRLVAMEDSFELLPEVWTALVNMPHLEYLLLHGLVWPYKTPFSTSFSPSTAPPTFSLKSLNLIYNYRKFGLFGDGRFTAGSAFSTWLLQNNDQLNEFSLDAPYSLFFNERDGSCTTFIHVMQPVLPRLKRLSLHLWRYQQEVPPGFSESFASPILH
ncbi:hypothetical protein DFH11DRAFT_1604090 [Phellopilus nigrolimitatus]|nr:hypothetical protein DFH11DRAFT_1604090 [Phellopilus nigrolimitatus]